MDMLAKGRGYVQKSGDGNSKEKAISCCRE